MKPRIITALTLALAAALPAAAQNIGPSEKATISIGKAGDLEAFFGVETVGTLQAIDHEDAYAANGNELPSIDPGFQTAWGNLEFGASYGKNKELEMFFDLYLASRPHASQTYGHQGYLLLHDVPENMKRLRVLDTVFDYIDIKAGHFQINWGDNYYHRSDNADVQRNPLIGNFVVDPEIAAVGAEIYTEPNPYLNAMLGLTSGTTTENFVEGRGNSVHAKVWGNPIQPLRLAGSYIAFDHSDNPTQAAGGTSGQFFSGNRSGERYGGIFGGGGAPGQVLPQAGQDLTAWQGDVTWDQQPIRLWLAYGNTIDQDINGSGPDSPEEEWNYYMAEIRYMITDNMYAAARYSGTDAVTVGGAASDGRVERIQVGGGYWLNRFMLAKLEYVHQTYEDFANGVVVSGVQAWRNPKFSGPLLEVSFSF